MISRFTIIFSILFFSLNVIAQNRSITFDHSNFKELQQKALKENKLIFIDAYTTWCGPCKLLASKIFTNDTIADYYNSTFINAKIDMEKGEGLEIGNKYSVSCFPTSLFIDGNGNLIHRDAGYMPVNMFLAIGKTANDREHNFSYYKNNYESKKNDSEFLNKYIEMISGACLDSKNEVAYYFSLQKESDLINAANWNMINEYVNDLDSREIKYVMANKIKFENLYTKEVVDKKINHAAKQYLQAFMNTNPFDKAKYELTKQKIEALNLSSGKQIIFEADLQLAIINKDWNTYTKLAMNNVDNYYLGNSTELNGIAWTFYENVSDKNALKKAEEWAKKSVELEPSYENLDTYAAVLYKNGKKEPALNTATKAIEFAKKENYTKENYQGTTDLLTKIKAMK